MNKILKIVMIVIFAISALIMIIFYAGGKETIELAAGGRIETYPKITNALIVWAYILTGAAVGFTVIFPVIQMISNPTSAKKGLLGILGLAVVIGIAYVIGSGDLLEINNPELVKYNVPSTLKYAGMMLYSTYILAGIAVVSMAYSEVTKIFK